MSDSSSFLNTGVTSAYFKRFGYYELENALLKLLYRKDEIKSLFSLIISTGISSVWKVFLILNLLTSLFFFFQWNKFESKTGTSYSLHVFINREDAGMISEFIDCCSNCILGASNIWFCGSVLVAQTSKYITEIVIKYFSYLKIFSHGFPIFR